MEYSSFSYPTSSESTSAASNKEKTKKKKKRGSGGGGSTTKLSTDPQSVAARQRRHRISDRFRILQSLVPGGSKMDTVSMLEEAIQYVKFLKTQIWLHQAMISFVDHNADNNINYPTPISFPQNDFPNHVPNFNHQQVDLCNNYINPVEQVQVETSTQVGLPYSWFQDDQEKYGYPICTNAEY